jgi:hypothetical protein
MRFYQLLICLMVSLGSSAARAQFDERMERAGKAAREHADLAWPEDAPQSPDLSRPTHRHPSADLKGFAPPRVLILPRLVDMPALHWSEVGLWTGAWRQPFNNLPGAMHVSDWPHYGLRSQDPESAEGRLALNPAQDAVQWVPYMATYIRACIWREYSLGLEYGFGLRGTDMNSYFSFFVSRPILQLAPAWGRPHRNPNHWPRLDLSVGFSDVTTGVRLPVRTLPGWPSELDLGDFLVNESNEVKLGMDRQYAAWFKLDASTGISDFIRLYASFTGMVHRPNVPRIFISGMDLLDNETAEYMFFWESGYFIESTPWAIEVRHQMRPTRLVWMLGFGITFFVSGFDDK